MPEMPDKQIQVQEWREGFFRSGGSVRLIPQSVSLQNTNAVNHSREVTKNGGNNRVSLFRVEKNYTINVSGDNSQTQIQIGRFIRFGG